MQELEKDEGETAVQEKLSKTYFSEIKYFWFSAHGTI